MLKLKEDGYDGVARVGLGPFGEYFFLQSADAVKSVTLDQADAFPRRFSVPLFETLELDRGIVYEQGEQHRANKRRCVPSFEKAIDQMKAGPPLGLYAISVSFSEVTVSYTVIFMSYPAATSTRPSGETRTHQTAFGCSHSPSSVPELAS